MRFLNPVNIYCLAEVLKTELDTKDYLGIAGRVRKGDIVVLVVDCARTASLSMTVAGFCIVR